MPFDHKVADLGLAEAGRHQLRLAEHEFPLRAGMEFLVPAGSRVSGRVTAGTRMMRGISARR